MEKISEIKDKLNNCAYAQMDEVIAAYETDSRAGVQKLVEAAKKRKNAYEAELKRLEEMRFFENKYSECEMICGVDEAGRGPLAGPVVAGAVILPKDADILYINDSKKLSEKRRNALYDEITNKAIAWGVGIVDEKRIDEVNIRNAAMEAMKMAVESLNVTPDLLLVDALTIPDLPIRQVAIVKGDAKSVSIAAGSIIAKVTRDRMMEEYDRQYPGYGFAQHKAYGTKAHYEALHRLGASPIHRMTFLKPEDTQPIG